MYSFPVAANLLFSLWLTTDFNNLFAMQVVFEVPAGIIQN